MVCWDFEGSLVVGWDLLLPIPIPVSTSVSQDDGRPSPSPPGISLISHDVWMEARQVHEPLSSSIESKKKGEGEIFRDRSPKKLAEIPFCPLRSISPP
ncbi:unnamed protein product [Linum trigynum]|uniref:Uncharacterized protein n=1 Tax=Linum trigynum TaxID=586398 RepID=A0AAV2F6Q2_9ROSI